MPRQVRELLEAVFYQAHCSKAKKIAKPTLEAAVLYRLNTSAKRSPGASISITQNSATMPAARQAAPLLVIMTADRSTAAAVEGRASSERAAARAAG